MTHEEIIENLRVTSFKCSAWLDFFKTDVLSIFQRAGGSVISHDLEELYYEFPYEPGAIADLITSFMRPGTDFPIRFKRTDIFDSRGWCTIPLACFVPLSGDVPQLKIGLRDMPWEITSDCFRLYHRIKRNDRLAEMYFVHPDQERGYSQSMKRGRWVAEEKFELGAKRPDMHAHLLASVRARAAEHFVRIIDLDALDRLEGRPLPLRCSPRGY